MKSILLILLIASPLLTIAQRTVSTAVTTPDTIYVSNQAKSYLLFDEPVTLADVGNPSLYQAQIEGNSVLVVASRDSVADTPFYAVVGSKPFTARLLFHPHPEAFYDFRVESKQFETTDAGEPAGQTLERLQQLSSYHDLNYAAARQNGIRFQLVGLVHDLSTTYLKFKLVNCTSLPYQTDFIGFERLKRYRKGFFAKDKEARFPLEPVAQWQVDEVHPHRVHPHRVHPHRVHPHRVHPHRVHPHRVHPHRVHPHGILPYSESYLYYALPIQSLERKEAIIATLREVGSSRSVSLRISSRLIRRADLY